MILDLAERMLNRNIAASTPAKRQAALLDGKRLAVEVDGMSLRIVCVVDTAQLSLTSDTEQPVDVTVKARPLDLLKLLEPDALSALKRTGAEIRGELNVAEGFGELLRLARPDLEEELARWISEIPAHEIGESLRGIDAWGRRSSASIEASVAEYLHDEARLLPTAEDVAAFVHAVDDLRDDVARAEQRLARLEEQLSAGGQ